MMKEKIDRPNFSVVVDENEEMKEVLIQNGKWIQADVYSLDWAEGKLSYIFVGGHRPKGFIEHKVVRKLGNEEVKDRIYLVADEPFIVIWEYEDSEKHRSGIWFSCRIKSSELDKPLVSTLPPRFDLKRGTGDLEPKVSLKTIYGPEVKDTFFPKIIEYQDKWVKLTDVTRVLGLEPKKVWSIFYNLRSLYRNDGPRNLSSFPGLRCCIGTPEYSSLRPVPRDIRVEYLDEKMRPIKWVGWYPEEFRPGNSFEYEGDHYAFREPIASDEIWIQSKFARDILLLVEFGYLNDLEAQRKVNSGILET